MSPSLEKATCQKFRILSVYFLIFLVKLHCEIQSSLIFSKEKISLFWRTTENRYFCQIKSMGGGNVSINYVFNFFHINYFSLKQVTCNVIFKTIILLFCFFLSWLFQLFSILSFKFNFIIFLFSIKFLRRILRGELKEQKETVTVAVLIKNYRHRWLASINSAAACHPRCERREPREEGR